MKREGGVGGIVRGGGGGGGGGGREIMSKTWRCICVTSNSATVSWILASTLLLLLRPPQCFHRAGARSTGHIEDSHPVLL